MPLDNSSSGDGREKSVDPLEPSLALERTDAELAKIRAETAKVLRDTEALDRNHVFELVKTIGTAVTASVALIGIFITFTSQRSTQLESERRRLDESVTRLLTDYGSVSSRSRLSAITSLSVFLGPRYPEYQARVASILATGVRIENDELLRRAARRALVGQPSVVTLSALRAENLVIQEELAIHLHATPFEVRAMDAPFARLTFPACDAASDSSARRAAAADTVIGRLERDLRWNAATLMESINAMRNVRDVDLSDVILSLDSVKASPTTDFAGNDILDVVQPADSLKISSVNLSGAKLSWLTFRDAQFESVNLDNATLAWTEFDGGKFSGSLADFRWWTQVGLCSYPAEPHWRHVVLAEVRAFEPALDPPQALPRVERSVGFRFDSSTWTLPQMRDPSRFPSFPSNARNSSYPLPN